MSVEQYWIGKDLELDQLWEDFESGREYIQEVSKCRLHLLRLTFAGHPIQMPLFDHEIIYKTVKGTFHDVKTECFTPEAYAEAVPIFLYSVERGSGIFEFLAQFDPLITWVVALGAAATWYRKALVLDNNFDQERFLFIKRNFPNASATDIKAYMKAWTTFGRRRVLHRLIDQGLRRVEMSREPLSDAMQQSQSMVDMQVIVHLRESRFHQRKDLIDRNFNKQGL